MYPSYSPLFTSGLLAVVPSTPRDDDASAFYFTLRTGRRDTLQLRSFLYLDLADRQHHAPSHRRKYSALSKSTSWTCTPTDVKFTHAFFARTEKPAITRRRTSKESLRNIPCPKPAPSTTLPDLPIASDPPSSPLPLSLSQKRAVSVTVSPLSSPTACLWRSASLRSESICSHDRRVRRMDALACLEGRSHAPNRIPRRPVRNNFMSFSDDEDDRSMAVPTPTATKPVLQTEDVSAFADVEDEVDAVIPSLSRKRQPTGPAERARPRKRRSTLESWFPLKSFIDLKDDDLASWNWRSFIEIGGVA